MKFPRLHRWDVTPAEGVALQRNLVGRIDTATPLGDFDLVAGADVSYNRFSDVIFASVVVWRASDGRVVETCDAVRETHFPYVPGLLTFREAPALLDAFARLKTRPDAIVLDGQGIAHPRRMGIASHVGLWLDRPTVGCAKSRLFGRGDDPAPAAGSTSPLTHAGDVVGMTVRLKTGVSPVFVSPGHRIDMAGSIRLVQGCARGYRLPEPTRLAHEAANAARRRGRPG
jgi:deoxyribonuclease V